MKTQNKRGFTIVELVVVIAVIAILAAILIPTFANLIRRANESSDMQLIRNLNTALVSDSATNGKHTTMQSALDAAEKFGYDVSKINASATDNEILWDSKNDVFCYYNDETKAVEYIPETNVTTTDVDDIDYWIIVGSKTAIADSTGLSSKYSSYVAKYSGTDALETIKGIDVSALEGVDVKYETEAEQSVVINTNGGTLVVNAPNSVVKHYGDATVLNIASVKISSYHEYGSGSFAEISSGRIALEKGSEVDHIHVTKNETTGKFDDIIIAKAADVEMPTLSRDDVEIDEDGTLVVALQNGTEEITESTELDYVWLTKQGIYEQITVSDRKDTAGETWVNTSDKSDETKTAAQQIANNIGRDANGVVAATVTVSDTEYTVTLDENRDIVVKTTGGETVENSDIIASATTSAVEAVADKESVQIGATLFAGGTGTENDPFLVYDYATMQRISDFYDTSETRKVNYFKVKDGITTIDCNETGKGWVSVNLLGSFDGNGVTFTNLNTSLFGEVNNAGDDYNTNAITIKDFTIKANIVTSNATALIGDLWNGYMNNLHLIIDSVNVEGYIEGSGGASSYIFYGPYYSTNKTLNTPSITFKNCISTATVVATGDMAAGFVKHGANAYYKIEDSLFLGTLSDTKSSTGYFNANSTNQFHATVSYSDGFLASYGITSDTDLYTYPTNGSLNSVDADANNWKVVSRTTLSKTTQTLPENAQYGDAITINKVPNASKAIVTLWIVPNDTNDSGSYLGCYMSETIDLSSGTSFTTDKIKYFDVQINGNATVATKTLGNSGYSADAKVFNVINSNCGNTHNGAYIQIVQYSANGTILSIQTISIAAAH